MIFTGSTVVDEHNTSGFCAAGKPCMVAVYTGHTPRGARQALQTQNLAYSNDRGRTWTKYSGNPVLNRNMADFRDPHVFWSDGGRRWVMAVALPNEHKVLFYGSADLKRWERLSDFGPAGATGGQWECPTLTEVPVEGERAGAHALGPQGRTESRGPAGRLRRAVFRRAASTARASSTTIRAATTLWTDYGKDCYCALTFNNLPRADAPVMLGWMSNWQYAAKMPTAPWRGQMTVPRRLQLRQGAGGLRLAQEPVESIRALRKNPFSWKGADAKRLNSALRGHATRGTSFELHATFSPGNEGEAGWRLRGANETYTVVAYDPAPPRDLRGSHALRQYRHSARNSPRAPPLPWTSDPDPWNSRSWWTARRSRSSRSEGRLRSAI